MESETYTGELSFRDIVFRFVYKQGELRLYPDERDKEVIQHEWLMKAVRPGVYVNGDPLLMEESFLEGRCHELRGGIVFLTQIGSYINSVNCTLIVTVLSIIKRTTRCVTASRLSLFGTCIDYVFPVNRAWKSDFIWDEAQNNGVVSITTSDFDSTTSKRFKVEVGGKEVCAYFSVGWTISHNIDNPPITLSSSLSFEFEETSDYSFLLELWYQAKRFLGFMTNQSDVGPLSGRLGHRVENGKYRSFAEMKLAEQMPDFDVTHLSKGRYLTLDKLEGNEEKLFQDVSSNSIYLRHLPRANKDKHVIDASRFVLVTAAFEWEFQRLYPDGVPKKDVRLEGEKQALEIIDREIESSTGETKQALKRAKLSIGFTNLQSKVIHAAKQFSPVIEVFGKRLYDLNGEEFKYSKIGERLAEQRNNFAHGNIDKDFEGVAILDLVYLGYLVLAMQLRYLGISDKGIQKAINVQFGTHIAV